MSGDRTKRGGVGVVFGEAGRVSVGLFNDVGSYGPFGW